MSIRYTMLKVVLLNFSVLAFGFPFEDHPSIQRAGEVCGYPSCPSVDNGVLNVHLVAHTHDDVGWLKTVDQYFFGSQNYIQKAGVQYIIDSVISELWEDPTRRFIYVETAFLWKWWERQSETMRERVHELVRQGRLEFIGGAWSMNDEAATHYQSTIDQFTFGLRILNDTFGECGRPKVGWQIDPFGHSKEFSSILAQMGYDGLFLGRIDYQDKLERMNAKTMEMVWRGDDNVGKPSDLFTGVLYNDYAPPRGFCFDILCNDEPIIDDKDSPLYNVDIKVQEFISMMNTMSHAYKHNHVLVTMGEDFHYQDAGMWFTNMDKLIFYANEKAEREGLKIKLFYSTPSCYLKAVKDSNITLPTKQDDFFPYASDEHSYWTGYFTSRPTTKYFERLANGYLQAVKQLQVVGKLDQDNEKSLHALKDAMGVMQHHDAITGTEKQHVTHDYERILTGAVDDALTVARQAFKKRVFENSSSTLPWSFDRCEFNQSQCRTTERNNNFILTIYNPLGWKVTAPIRVPIVEGKYSVTNPAGEKETIQIEKLSYKVLDIPTRRSKATHELTFIAEHIPALGFKQYYIKKLKNSKRSRNTSKNNVISTDNISNEHYTLKLDANNELSEISLADGNEFEFSCDFYIYRGYVGDNVSPDQRSSGAYIFRPFGPIYSVFSKTVDKVIEGPIFDQIEYHYELGSLALTLYKHAEIDDIEVTWTVGVNVADGIGKEVVIKYKTDINNMGEFFTDASGRQMVKRNLNQRPQWHVVLAEPISGNYYPVVNKIHINDIKTRFSVITDRSQGGTSLNNGNIELMLHRRLLKDDAKGVGEPLNEVANGEGLVARGNHYLYLMPITKENSIREKKRTIEHHLKPQVYVSDAINLNINDWLKLNNEWSGLATALPEGIHLLTLEPWTSDSLLLRLENYLENNDNEKVITVDVANLFNGMELIKIDETNLAANQWIEEYEQWSWATKNSFNKQYGTQRDKVRDSPRRPKAITDFNVGLGPKEYRTFIIKYEYKN